MKAKETIGMEMNLSGGTITIKFTALDDNQEEVYEYTKNLYKNIENVFIKAQNHEMSNTFAVGENE